jgi:hypothetical protein
VPARTGRTDAHVLEALLEATGAWMRRVMSPAQ